MTLQNRVDPFGDIHAVDARGMLTGNRGIIHDPATRTLLRRRWASKAWIICTCDYKGIRRNPMGRNGPNGATGWTELFFLDEVTALAAGHRPCFTCRRAAAKLFAGCYGRAFGKAAPRAPEIDERLHRQRRASGGSFPQIEGAHLATLPDGTMFLAGDQPHGLRGGKALRWSFWGYDGASDAGTFRSGTVSLVTPEATVAVLRQGYEPVWHPSADRLMTV